MRTKNPDQGHEGSACGGPERRGDPERPAKGTADRTTPGDAAGFFHRHARHAGIWPGRIAAQNKDCLVKIPPVGTGYHDHLTGNAFYHSCVRSFCRRIGPLQSVCPRRDGFIQLWLNVPEQGSGAAPKGWRHHCVRRGAGSRPSGRR